MPKEKLIGCVYGSVSWFITSSRKHRKVRSRVLSCRLVPEAIVSAHGQRVVGGCRPVGIQLEVSAVINRCAAGGAGIDKSHALSTHSARKIGNRSWAAVVQHQYRQIGN